MKKFKAGGKYEKMRNGQIISEDVDYMILENAEGGEFFDFLVMSGQLSESMARHYFLQLLQGLDHCHRNGFAHRDLKCENILLDDKYDLKIADFGFAGPVDGRDGKGTLSTYVGTENYMPPEVYLEQPYYPRAVDVFTAGIILFTMVAGHPPFNFARSNDVYYKCIASNRSDLFWKLVSKGLPPGFYSDDFKDIIVSMLQLDPNHRPTMSELFQHPWVTGPLPSGMEFNNEIKTRRDKIEKEKYEEM